MKRGPALPGLRGYARRALAVFGFAVAVLFSRFLDVRRGQYITPITDWVPGGDFTGHAAFAFLISIAVNFGLIGLRGSGRVLGPRLPTALVMAFFTFEEMHQAVVPGRQVQVQDLAASLIGASIGGALIAARLRGRTPAPATPARDFDAEPV